MNRLLLTALLFMYSFSYSVNVTFRVNSSTVDGVVDSTSGVDLRGTVTQWGPGTNMVSDGGDYWSLTVALEPGNYAYKYGAQIKNEDGTISDYWENDIPGANYVGGDRTLTVGSTDMTIDLDYLGSGPGTPYYEMTETGSISWDVTLADAGTYSLVVHNRAPYGTKGNHVRVNGVGLKNRTTNGEWMFDYTYPADGSFLATVVSEDSLVDVTGTPLQLAAGTHTISIEKSWGYMDFGKVELYSGDAATTGTLLETLSIPDAVAEGVTLAKIGGDGSYTPSDSVDILFRVNMSENPDFDPANHTLSMVGHFPNSGSSNMWSPGTYQLTRESATSDYWSYHLKLAQGYVDTVYDNQVSDAPLPLGLHMYRFVIGDQWSNSENLNGEYAAGNENRTFMVDADLADTTVQWVYWNNKGPEPFEPTGTLSTFTFSTSVANAIAGNGFALGDTLLVKYGYGGTQTAAMEDTLVNSIGNVYSVAIADFPFNANLGLYYQYYRVKNGVQYRETYFNFAYTGDEQPLAERRYIPFTGATNGGTADVSDNVSSTVDERRQPIFRNTDQIGQEMIVTYTVDVRPAYYQIMSGDTLNDIQGSINISDASEIFTRGISINGPATGDWVTWGATLDGTAANKMHDDGTNGDAVAGDSVYTVQYSYIATQTIGQEFKFGIGGGDNESGYGLNHIENIDVTTGVVASYWGSINPNKYDAWNYDTNMPTLSIDEIHTSLTPRHFALSDNYPNPFNPVTSFSFALPHGTEVSVNVYNIIGKKVATLYNGYAKPGNYKVTWNGKDTNGLNLPSGLYIYELDAGAHFKQTKKMTLIK